MILTQLIYVQLLHEVNIVAFTLDYIEDIIYYKKSDISFLEDSTLTLKYKDKEIPVWYCFGRNLNKEDFEYFNKGIIFKYENKYLFLPVIDILEQTDGIIKNFTIRVKSF